jgi:murein DD-endopeptidase MepM/ murein hydrolase activator NlpD
LHSILREYRPGGPSTRRAVFASLIVSCLVVSAGGFAATGSQDFVPMLRPVIAGAPDIGSTSQPPVPASADARTSVTIKAGDSLAGALMRGGVSKAQTYDNLAKLKAIDAKRLQPGDKLTIGFVGAAGQRRVASVTWSPKRGSGATVALLPGSSGPTVTDSRPTDAAMILKAMVVHGSVGLPRTLTESGMPPAICEQVIIALSQLRRPPVHGELVKIVYLVPADPLNGPSAQLRYASFTSRDGKSHVVHYTALATPASLQHVDLTPASMVALWEPLPGARISSPFGWRVHPVLHTRRFHKGVDYEAALGTPVVAAADGVVEDFGPRGTYGNYIRLRHTGRLETAYAHLSGFAPTLAVGTPVHRGDVIGYVGMTGIATGPHLYYELLVDGRQIDPEGQALKDAIRRQQLPQTASMPLP